MEKKKISQHLQIPDYKKGPYTPSAEEIEQAKQLDKTVCPRRYCWFWRSKKFEFDIPVSEGCHFANDFAHNPRRPAVCARDTGDPLDLDWYEPREPYLREDGFSDYYFFSVKAGRTRVYLGVDNYYGNPTEITTVIGIEPTKSWKKGELSAPNSRYRLLQSGWQFFSPLPLSKSVDEQLNALLNILESHKQGIIKATSQFSMGIYIIEANQDFARFRLSQEIIARVAELGLCLDLWHQDVSVDNE